MIEKLLVGLVLGILQFLMTRRDQTTAAKSEVYREAWALAKKAYNWEVDAMHRTDGGGDLRVQDGAGPIKLSGSDSSSDRSATGS